MGTASRTSTTAAAIGIAAVTVVALGGGTYAAFTDSTSGPGGSITAGTLDLDLRTKPRTTATILDESGIYPGKVLAARTLTLRNTGSLNGSLSITVDLDTHGGHLQDQLTVSVNCTSDNPSHPPYVRTDVPLAAVLPTTAMPLDSDEQVICTFRFALPDRADNNLVQGDRLTVKSVFTLAQTTSG